MTNEQKSLLLSQAKRVRENAYAPYSGFSVGAALLAADGNIFVGCNTENASYSATVCAERNAFAAALAKGTRRFTAIAVVGGRTDGGIDFCMPCGICRQVMAEHCDPDFLILTENAAGEVQSLPLSALLPNAFKLS